MKKFTIKVPSGIKYISDWKDYTLPKGHIIVDKGVTGCGYTEYCLGNNENVVLCSPRKLLLENKRDQHTGDLNILYLENGITDYTGVKDLGKIISQHIFRCTEENEACKFMVTYDSLHYLTDYIKQNSLSHNFVFVVDEFQSIFLDSYFKSGVELDFVDTLQGCENVLYLSATPMLEKYLDRLPEFKDLPYQILDWSETGFVEKARVLRKRTKSLAYECGLIVDSYLKGDYKITLDLNGVPTESKEAVFYLNSVSEILRVVKSKGLTPDNTRIICSDTPDNQKKLGKLGFKVGKVPVPSKGETNPMFMFCTSTVYVGVDFYSSNARTFVFADPNVTSLGTDISIDLPQIAGRQRDRGNPFKNEITIFYKTQKNPVTYEEFQELQDRKKNETGIILRGFEKLSNQEKISFLQKLKRDSELYRHDFVGISEKTNLPVYNYLVDIANERAWEVSQKDYQDCISVTCALEDSGFEIEDYKSGGDLVLQDFLDNHFYKTGLFADKMKMYCEFCDTYGGNSEIMTALGYKIQDPKYKMYYDYYGTRGCSAAGYKEANLYRGWRNITKDDKLKEIVLQKFKVSEKYSMMEIKNFLKETYLSLGISKNAKATDLGGYFEMKKVKMTLPDKSVVNGFKLLGIL